MLYSYDYDPTYNQWNAFLPPDVRFYAVDNDCERMSITFDTYFGPERTCRLIYRLGFGGEIVFHLTYYRYAYEAPGDGDRIYNTHITNIEFINFGTSRFTQESLSTLNRIVEEFTDVLCVVKAINCYINIFLGGNTLNINLETIPSLIFKDSTREKKLKEIEKDFED